MNNRETVNLARKITKTLGRTCFISHQVACYDYSSFNEFNEIKITYTVSWFISEHECDSRNFHDLEEMKAFCQELIEKKGALAHVQEPHGDAL